MDTTGNKRREMLADMPQELLEHLEQGGQIWTTEEFREEFEATGFMAPFVVVRRRSDGVVGSLKFTHNPRFYFDFTKDGD